MIVVITEKEKTSNQTQTHTMPVDKLPPVAKYFREKLEEDQAELVRRYGIGYSLREWANPKNIDMVWRGVLHQLGAIFIGVPALGVNVVLSMVSDLIPKKNTSADDQDSDTPL